MPILFWDASALVKRYCAESGSSTVNALLQYSPRPTMIGTFWGYTETYAILARKRNAGHLNSVAMETALSVLYYEVIAAENFDLLSIDDKIVMCSVTHIMTHNINSADAALLTAFLEYQADLPDSSPTCVLVTADLRLVRAAQAEGLQTLNPETMTPEEATALLSSLS